MTLLLLRKNKKELSVENTRSAVLGPMKRSERVGPHDILGEAALRYRPDGVVRNIKGAQL